MSKLKFPSADFFKSQVPSIDSFVSEAKSSLGNVTSQFPTVNDLKGKFEDKVKEKIGGIDIYNLPEPKSTGELASIAAGKLGINVDSAKIDKTLEEIEDFKAGMTAKTLEGAKTLADKVGIKLPNIPSEEEIAQMIVDSDPETVMDIESKIASIESLIQSKLS